MAKPLSALTSVCDCSEDFETIVYAQFHVMCEFDCKFEKEETNFHHSIHPTNFVFKNKLKIDNQEQYPNTRTLL